MSGEIEYGGSGLPIYRHKAREKPFELAIADGQRLAQLEAHIARYVGTPGWVYHEIVSDLVHIDVHVIEPTASRDFYTLVTTGMSDRPMTVPEGCEGLRRAELMISLPSAWQLGKPGDKDAPKDERNYWPLRWLKILARMPHEYDTFLASGHTVPNGDPPQPFAGNCRFCCMLVVPSAIVGDRSFQTLASSGGDPVRFYALLPLYREEMDLKVNKGLDPLLDGFDKAKLAPRDLEIVDLTRKNACTRSRWPF